VLTQEVVCSKFMELPGTVGVKKEVIEN
jgi:hypothetical protein